MYRNDPNYNWFFVPEDKFMEYWSDDVVDYERAEDEEGLWIFWYLR